MLHFDLISSTSIPTSFNISVNMFLHLFDRFLLCVETCINLLTLVLSGLKRLRTSAFGSSEPLLLLRLMGVSVPSIHIKFTDSMIHTLQHFSN